MRCFTPNHVCVGRIGKSPGDGHFNPAFNTIKSFRAPVFISNERAVPFVYIAGNELCSVCVRPGNKYCGCTGNVSRKPGGNKFCDELLCRNKNFASHMPAFFCRGKLIFKMDSCSTGFYHTLHKLKRIERPAEARFRIGNDRGEPVGPILAII